MRKNLTEISKKKFIVRKILIFCFFLFSLNNLCSCLFAQEYSTTIDWLNFVDVPSYFHGGNFRFIETFYSVNSPFHKEIYTKGEHLPYASADEVVRAGFITLSFNWDLPLSKRIKLGVFPIGVLVGVPGGFGGGVLMWTKLKYFPFVKKDLFFRLALHVPYFPPPPMIEKKWDADLSVCYSKEISEAIYEILLSYRHPDAKSSNYGKPRNEFHYRISIDFKIGENTKQNFFIIGYFGEDKIEYFYHDKRGERTSIYKKPYKLSTGITISKFFKAGRFFHRDTWVNISFLKTISWRNELGGWGLVLGFGI